MPVHGLLFITSGADFAALTDEPARIRATKAIEVYSVVNPKWRDIKPFNSLTPLTSLKKFNFRGKNFELVEVWVNDPKNESCTKLWVDRYNLHLIKHVFVEDTDIKFDIKFETNGYNLNCTDVLDAENLKFIGKLLKCGANVSYRQPEEGNLAHFSVERSAPTLIPVLQKCGVNLSVRRYDGRMPLHIAMEKRNLAMVNALLDNGADIDGQMGDGRTALHIAVEKRYFEEVGVLLERGVDVNAKTERQWTPLHQAAAFCSAEIVELLLKGGANIEAKALGASGIGGVTPLLSAFENLKYWKSESMRAVRVLIKNGADVEAVDTMGNNALYRAVVTHAFDIIEELLAQGLDVNSPGNQRALKLAIHGNISGYTKSLKILVMNGFSILDADAPEAMSKIICELGEGFLSKEDFKEYFDVLVKLLEDGFDVNQEYISFYDGQRTALGLACGFGNDIDKQVKVVQLLLDYGANPIGEGGIGAPNSPIVRAVVEQKMAVVKVLLDRLSLVSDRAIYGSLTDGHISLENLGKMFGIAEEDSTDPAMSGVWKVLASHLVRQCAILNGDISVELSEIDTAALREKCERELESMRGKNVSNTGLSYFDLLLKDMNQVVGLLRDKKIRTVLTCTKFKRNFPEYGSILQSHVRAAAKRQEFLVRGMKAVNRLFLRLPKLPIELKEDIVQRLANHDIIKLELSFKTGKLQNITNNQEFFRLERPREPRFIALRAAARSFLNWSGKMLP